MKATNRKFRMELTEKQLNVIGLALEEYFRLASNQWSDLANRLSMSRIEVNAGQTRFETCVQTRNSIQAVFETAGKILRQNGVRPSMGEPELIAQDIWDAIRQKIRELDNPMDDSRALCVADEPLPRIELMEDDHGN